MPATSSRRSATSSSPATSVVDWLLEGDPAIRWQTLRDLRQAPATSVERERAKVARTGWGARLLAKQERDGRWAGGRGKDPDRGLYTPKWVSTTYTMLLLRDFGLAPTNRSARAASSLLLERGLNRDGGIAYGFWQVSETCVTGMILSLLSYFEYEDDRLESIVAHLLERQMPDGGWNCRWPKNATHASMNTTISALEGLRHYELLGRSKAAEARAAQKRGREFLLAHRLFKSHRTGKPMKPEFTRLVFPPRWHYDVLRALDHFRDVDARRDERLSDAIELLASRRDSSDRWPLDYEYRGRVYFRLERVGAPSRWNTLRALRVFQWWNA